MRTDTFGDHLEALLVTLLGETHANRLPINLLAQHMVHMFSSFASVDRDSSPSVATDEKRKK